MNMNIQRKDIHQIFRMTCSAFPHSNVQILNAKGEIVLSRNIFPEPRSNEEEYVQEGVSAVMCEGKRFLCVQLKLTPYRKMKLYVEAEGYRTWEEPLKMLQTLVEAAETSSREPEREYLAEIGDNQLLNNLLYADTMEMRIYTYLLAEERDKNLELPRVVCVIRGKSEKRQEMLELINNYRKTDAQDICGSVGEETLVLCRYLREPGKTIKFQCDGYLHGVCELIEEKCGFVPEIWVGTLVCQIEDYGFSMKAAFAVGQCAQGTSKEDCVIYAQDYLVEYTFYNTPEDVQAHFLEPYAERLKKEPELLETAEALIENNMNISLAAQKKYVHRNTMMIHARRLWQLLNIDPVHKDNDRFLLMLICTYFRKNHYES